MKIFNLIIIILIAGISGWALSVAIEHNEQKANLVNRGDVLAKNIADVCKSYDSLLGMDLYSKDVTAKALDHKVTVENLRKAMSRMCDQASEVKNYQDELIKGITDFATQLTLTAVSTTENLEKVKEELQKAETIEAQMVAFLEEASQIRQRDDNLFAKIIESASKLDVAVTQESLRGYNNEHQAAFKAINDKIVATKARRGSYETGFQSVASALEASTPSISSDLNSTVSSLGSLVSDARSKIQRIADQESEIAGLERDLADRRATIQQRDQKIASLESDRLASENKIKEYRTRIWDPDSGEAIPQILKESNYSEKYALVHGRILQVNEKWQCVQIDIGRTCIAEQPIGNRGMTNKIRAPLYEKYEMEVYRGEGKDADHIATIELVSVGEHSAIANIVKATSKIQPSDVVRFSTKTIEKLSVSLGGTVTDSDADAAAEEIF